MLYSKMNKSSNSSVKKYQGCRSRMRGRIIASALSGVLLGTNILGAVSAAASDVPAVVAEEEYAGAEAGAETNAEAVTGEAGAADTEANPPQEIPDEELPVSPDPGETEPENEETQQTPSGTENVTETETGTETEPENEETQQTPSGTESAETESTEPEDAGLEDIIIEGVEEVPSGTEESESESESEDLPGTEACIHHPVHNAECGYTEENPVCTFVCAICPVQEQIDKLLAELIELDPEDLDNLDETAMETLYKKICAVYESFMALTPEEQEQIEGAETLIALMELLEAQLLADTDIKGMKIATAEIRAEGVGNQSLTGETSFTVDFSKQFTLHIAVESELNLANKKVEITVPDGLTVVEYPIPERGGMAESVTPESIDELHSENNYGGYCPTNGTITYSLKNTAEKNSFNIVLAPDTVLWNRSSAQVLKDPLKIRVYTDDQTYQTISATPKITGNYIPSSPSETAGNRAIQTGPRLSRVGVKSGVPTAANQPFALRQIWINPDKDYIDMPQFFKKLEITIALPYYTKEGSNIYAEFDHITWDPAGQSTRPNLLDPKNHKGEDGSYKDAFTFTQKTNENDHTVTLTWENLYLEYGQDYFTPYFKWTSNCDVTTTNAVKWGSALILNTGKTAPGCYEGKTPDTGAASAVGGTITWQDNSTWYLYNGDCTTFSFTAQAGESMSVNGKANNKPIYNNHAGDSDIIYYLGQFHVVNQGGAASAEKTVEFAYANNDKIGVTAQKIPATTGNTVEVWYTTTKSPTERKHNGEFTSSGGFVTFTTQMAGLGEDEYFTKIRANVGSYEKDYVGYVSSRDQDPTSGYATTFGKLLTEDAGTYTNFASMKMYDTASGDSTVKSGNYLVNVTNTRGEIPLAMEQAYEENSLERVPILSKTSATAGDTITFNGLLSSSAYPYSSNNIATDQEIYIRLPEKITVENLKLYQEEGRTADKVFLLDAVTETVVNPTRTVIPETAYEFEDVTSAEAAADDTTATVYKLYKITFMNQDDPAKVGWFTDGLGQYQIGISFDMNIAKDADAMTLDMRDCVRFKSASLVSTSNNGTLAQYQVMDNGVRYSTFNVNAKGTKLSVVAARLGLTFTFGAKMTEKGSEAVFDATKYSNFEVDKSTVYLKDANHVVDMLFTLKNETGRAFSKEDAHAFYYFIPVPEKNDLWDSHMQEQAFEFDMSLTRAPELQGTSAEHILVTYATEIESGAQAGEEKHYTNTANYKTEKELLDGCATDEEKAARWKKVKMIRIAAKPGIDSIPKNAELKVNMRLEPMFDENADLVGSEINFGPCGVSPYSVGNTPNQGHNPLPRIQVEFQTGVIDGKIFIDKDFNGTYDEGTDVLYTGSVTVEANHSNGNENCTEGDAAHKTTASDGTFKFTGRRADTYHVTVTNPGSTDANGNNPLKFSLPESGGKFSLDTGKNTATASVVLDMNKTPNDIKDAGSLLIGFQQPHTVTFTAENASLDKTSTNVWHTDKLGDVIPTVTADKDYRFTGNWTDGAKTYTADQLKEVTLSSDVTFTAEVKQLYSLTYDLNGGSGAAAPATSTHIEGEKVRPDYTDTKNLKKGEKTIFVGWSKEQIQNPLLEDATEEDIDKIISADEHTMPAHNVVLYAVYAVDGNGNGNPDYNDDAVHVRYHGNNGDYTDIICPHHHVAGATAQLSTSGTVSGKSLDHDKPASAAGGEVTSHTFTFIDKTTGNAHIFIGWSTSPILDTIIKTKADYDGLASSIVTEVTMEKAKTDGGNADADGNTNVYAVWAADRNNNGVADYREECKLTYDGNAQQSGTVTNVPAEVTVVNGTSIIPGDTVTLSETRPTHGDVGGKTVVFIGWTETQTNSIFSRADIAPIITTKVTFGSANKTVYAAWGYDENGNGTADVLETYTLTYNLNGGSGNAPTAVSGIKKNAEVKLTEEKGFTRNPNEIFVGWSATKHEVALTAQDKQEDVEKFLITGTTYRIGTADVTLYAVWAADRNGNNTADYLEKHKLTYNGNAQQGGTVSAAPTDNTIYIPGDRAVLSEEKPAHSEADGKKVVFIGWTEAQTNTIFSRTDTAPTTVTEVTFGSADKTVYAAWGYDENDNGTADVLETYTLTYDLNGGSGNEPTAVSGIAKNTEVTLTVEKNFTRNPNEIFVGWSVTRLNDALTAATKQEDLEKLLITGATYRIGTKDVTLYAVWAADRNGNNTADYLEKHKLTYNGNAQQGGTVSTVPTDNNIYIPGDKAELSEDIPTHSNVDGKKVVFIGWTEAQTNEIFSRADTAPTTITKVTFESADKTVYAAWGYDENRDGTADVLETYTLTYDLNGGSGNEPTAVSGIAKNTEVTLTAEKNFTRNPNEIFVGWSVTRLNDALTAATKQEDLEKLLITGATYRIGTADVTLYAVWAADRNGNNTADYLEKHKLTYNGNAQQGGTVSTVPTDNNIYIPGDKAELSEDIPTHSNVDGKKVVFIGWTEAQTNEIFSRADTAPTTITKVTFESADKTVYAAWGYDENRDGTADVLETYTLTYDLNGGNGTAPAKVSGIAKNTEVKLTEEKGFTRNPNEIFVGWSATKHEAALTAQDKQEDVEKFLITGAKYRIGTADVTLYAVWAIDRNGNNTADYLEKHKLTYNGNAQQGGTVSAAPTDNNIYIPGDKAELSKDIPTHSNVDGKKVVFIGWTETQKDSIFSRTDTAPATVTEVTFGNADKTVYAAWGYDENNDGTADVLETYTLTYDLNGGNEAAPAKVSGIKKNTEVKLTEVKKFTRNPNEIFVGWSVTKYEAAVTAEAGEDEVDEFLILPGATYQIATADVTLYAVWAVDANGDKIPDYRTTYTVTYDLNEGTGADGEDYTKAKVKPGMIVTVKEAPIRSGYAFTGWSGSEEIYQPGDTVLIMSGDLTLTAQWAKLYDLSYDLNGGSGADTPKTTQHIKGEKVIPDYTGTEKLTKGEKTIFAGWSETKIGDVLPADALPDTIGEIITADEYKMPARDVTLYAVYAVDANGNGKPDYNDAAVHVRYHGNNEDHSDIICPHHHVAGAAAELSTSGTVSGKSLKHDAAADTAENEIKEYTFTYGTNIFIGWSTTPILDTVIKTRAEYDALAGSIVTEVTMLAKPGPDVSAEDAKDTGKYADADGNTNVYAVWAADRNNNGTADYQEERTLTYDENAQQDGRVENMPVDDRIYLPGDTVKLTGIPTHSDVNGRKVAFIGWTKEPTQLTYSRANSTLSTIEEVTFGDESITVYAAWGYEKDTEEPTEKPTEKPEEPTEKPTEKPEEPTEKPTEKPEEPTEKPTEKPEEPTEKPTEKPEEPTEKPTEKPEEPTEKPTEEPEESTEEPGGSNSGSTNNGGSSGSGSSSNYNTSVNNSSSPKTGDETNAALWVILMTSAGIAMISALAAEGHRKRTRRKK